MRGLKKFLIFAFVSFLSASLFASGAKEAGENETLVKVIDVTYNDGIYTIEAQKEDGSVIIYHASSDTTSSSYALENITSGDFLMVVDNGMMTMSLPPQSTAVSIRYVTPAVKNGLIQADFSLPVTNPALILDFGQPVKDDLVSSFSYSYGWLSMKGMMEQKLYPDAGYFARGILDASKSEEVTPLLTFEEMNSALDEFVNEVINKGLPTTYGKVITSEEEINALDVPETLEHRFAYSYGYFSTLNILYNGIEISAEEFASGMLTALYGASPVYTEEEMNGYVDQYIAKLEGDYQKWLDELAAANLEKAEAYLADNASREGVTTLDSGVQIEFITKDPENGAHPAADSNVTVDYTLTLADGTVMDSGTDVQFNLQNLIPGFRDAVLQMSPGDSVKAVVPPEQGYGVNGTGNIEPNSLLIFDITLKSIDDSEA